MTVFADIDADGRARGFYLSWLHAVIPDGAVPIPEEVHAAWIQDTQRQRWTGDALETCDPPVITPVAPPPIRRIAPLAFRRRLGAGTRAALTLAASRALEAGDATLQTWLDDVSACRVVDLDDPELHAAVATLRAADLITEAQSTALLADGTPQEV